MSEVEVGGVTVDRVVEAEGAAFYPGYIFPDAVEEEVAQDTEWMQPNFQDAESGRLLQGNHCFVLRRPGMVLLVDTCIGNDKPRPSTKTWNNLQTDWLDQLGALGVAPEEVTHVVNTHLHIDHCGWNTKLEDGRWVPTFPNATYFFPKDEFDFWSEPSNDTVTGVGANDGCFFDSCLPVHEAGLAKLIGPGDRIDDDVWFESAAGHSPGQVTLNVNAEGQRLIFTGDLFHSPLQLTHPDWSSKFDIDRKASAEMRRRFIAEHGDTDAIILAAHVVTPNAGRIVRHDDGRWIFRLLKDL